MKYKYSRKRMVEEIKTGIVTPLGLEEMLLEPAEWPQKGDGYWIIGGGTVVSRRWDNDSLDNEFKDFGNYFRTKKEAIKARDKIKKLLNK